jgi:hypothetical protein
VSKILPIIPIQKMKPDICANDSQTVGLSSISFAKAIIAATVIMSDKVKMIFFILLSFTPLSGGWFYDMLVL